ncbi:MAG: hypothetical protein ACXWKH_19535, partial [Limisphaerales bacterium]
GHEAGPMGHLLHFLFNPAVLGVGVATFAVEQFRKSLEDVKKAAEESAAAAEAALKRFADTNQKVAQDSAMSWDEFTRKMKDAERAPDALGERFKALQAQIEAVTGAEKDLLEAQKALEIWKIDHSNKTDDEKATAKANVETRFKDSAEGLQEKKASELLQNRLAEMAVREGKDTILTPIAAAAEKHQHDVDARLESLKDFVGKGPDQINALQKTVTAAKDNYDSMQSDNPRRAAAWSKAVSAQRELEELQKGYNAAVAEQLNLMRQKATLEAEAARTSKDAADNKARIKQLEAEIAQLRQIADAIKPITDKTKTARDQATPGGAMKFAQTEDARTIPGVNGQANIAAADTLTKARNIEAHIRNHSPSPEEFQQLQNILGRIHGLIENKNVSNSTKTALRDLERKFELLEHKIHGLSVQ